MPSQPTHRTDAILELPFNRQVLRRAVEQADAFFLDAALRQMRIAGLKISSPRWACELLSAGKLVVQDRFGYSVSLHFPTVETRAAADQAASRVIAFAY